jgi:hypothetical protein
VNNSGGNQTFTVIVKNYGAHCRITVTWKALPDDPVNPRNPHTIVALAEKNETGSGTFVVNNGSTIRLYWECATGGENNPCAGEVVIYQHT